MPNLAHGRFSRKLAVVLVVVAGCLSTSAQQTINWTDNNGTQSWSDSGNWDAGIVPGKDCTNCSVHVPGGTPGNPTEDVSSPITLNNLTIDNLADVVMPSNASLTLNGTTLSGFLIMNQIGGSTTNLIINSDVIYTNAANGGMAMDNNSSITGSGTFENQGNVNYALTVAGTQGQIGDGTLTVKNSGTIAASGTNASLTLVPNANWINSGNIQANLGAKITITGGTINQQATGQIGLFNGGIVNLGGSFGSPTIVGGTLEGNLTACPSATLNNVTNQAVFNVKCGSGISSSALLVGTINNNFIQVTNTDNQGVSSSSLVANGPVTLAGVGDVELVAGFNGFITGTGTLTVGSQQSIFGAGTINVLSLINQGGIHAVTDQGNNTLKIQSAGGLTNTGTINAAASGAVVEISGGTVTNTGGTISSGNNGGFAILDNNVTVVGGTLQGTGGQYVEGKLAILDGSSSPVTINGLFEVLDADKTTLKGTINGTGNIVVSGCPDPTVVHASGTTVIQAGVGVTLANDCAQNSFQGDGKNSVTIAGSLSGEGVVSNMGLTISRTGTLTAGPQNFVPLTIDKSALLKVQGTVTVDPGSTLQILGPFPQLSQTGTFSGGNWTNNGTIVFPGGDTIFTNKAKITLDFPYAIVNQNNQDAISTIKTNIGSLSLGPSATLSPSSNFLNTGSVSIANGAVFAVSGSGDSYNQSGAKVVTIDDGTLSVPAGGTININGGTLQGANSSLQGPVSVGNASGGAAAAFIIGDSKKQAGAISITQSYTQMPTGGLYVQIGGTNPGSQFSVVNVTGPVVLGGTLNLSRINKFVPQLGDSFPIINAPSGITGTFTTVNGTNINANEHFSVIYNPNSVVLDVVPGP